jgi:hypothetical protein
MRLLLNLENRRADPPRRTARLRKNTPRESNPHFRPGEAAGCHYIMVAFLSWSNCQRTAHDQTGAASNRDGRRAVPISSAVGPSQLKLREHRVGVEPTFPHYGCGVLAAERPVLVVVELVVMSSVGPEGLEPSPTWLRARHAAANTLIPCAFSEVGPEGFEPTPRRLKVCCATVTPRPRVWPWLCFKR